MYQDFADRRSAGNNSLIETMQYVMESKRQQEALDAAEAEKQRQASMEQSQDPAYILSLVNQGREITPHQKAILDITSGKSQRAMFDPNTGQLVQTGGFPEYGGQEQRTPLSQQSISSISSQGEALASDGDAMRMLSQARNPKEREDIRRKLLEEEFEKRKAERKMGTEKEESKKFSERSLKSLSQTVDNMDSTIEKALGQVSGWSAGRGSLLSVVPETDAADLSSTLKTIQADAAFGRLQEMRDNSKTGGALGAVSEKELQLLQNAKVALDQSQSPEQLRENLKNYQRIRRQALENAAKAYSEDYGVTPEFLGEKEITSQAEFDALPSGAVYLEDGKKYRKP